MDLITLDFFFKTTDDLLIDKHHLKLRLASWSGAHGSLILLLVYNTAASLPESGSVFCLVMDTAQLLSQEAYFLQVVFKTGENTD